MPDNFAAGESDSESSAPPIEKMGARYGIAVTHPAYGDNEHLSEPYLMPTVVGRNGSMEKVDPAITLTPLGGMMPGPNAIAPAIVVDGDYHQPVPDEAQGFKAGLRDGFPEGVPIPFRP